MRHLPPFLRAIIGAAIGFVIFAALATSIQRAYYFVMPGGWFVNYYYAHVDDVLVGQPPALNLCRRIHYSDVKLEATRTFVYQQQDGRFEPVSQYTFAPVLQDRKNPCQTYHLDVKHQPQSAGTYRIHTTGVFYVGGLRKTISYDTNDYHLIQTPTSIQSEIEKLQAQIDALKALLTTSPGSGASSRASASTQAVRAPLTVSGAAPEPSAPIAALPANSSSASSSSTSLLQPVVSPVTTLLTNTVDTVRGGL